MDAIKRMVHESAKNGKASEIESLLKERSMKEIQSALNHSTSEDKDLTTPLLIAAKNCHVKVVELLLVEYCVYPDQTGTVVIENQVMNHVTPLWLTGNTGNTEIGELLIKAGACVDHPTATLSTPLRVATYQPNIEIIKLLIKHKANVNAKNMFGQTALMNLSGINKNTEAVRILLEAGANPNVKTNDKSTPLFSCVNHGTVEDAQELLKYGAIIQVANDEGITPLQKACIEEKEEMFKCLVAHKSLSSETKINAFELIGASSTAKDTTKGYKYMLQAILLLEKIKKGKPQVPPVNVYLNRRECNTAAELEKIKEDSFLLNIEALMIIERILGKASSDLIFSIGYFAATLADEKKYKQALPFVVRSINLQYTAKKKISVSLELVISIFAALIGDQDNLNPSAVLSTLEMCCSEVIKLKRDKAADLEGKINLDKIMLFLIQLICLLQKMNKTPAQISKFSQLVKSLCQMNVKSNAKQTLLHVACLEETYTTNNEVIAALSFPNTEVVRVLLQAGCDPNLQDNDGNTAMHIIVQYVKATSEVSTLKEIVGLFADAKANMQLKNKKGENPLEVAAKNINTAIQTDQLSSGLMKMVDRIVKKK